MTKLNNLILVKGALCFLFLSLLTSCDKEFNTIGVDIVGNDNFLFEIVPFDVTLANKNFGPVQTNDLPINALGIYTNPLGETTAANFVTQLSLAAEDPTIDLNLHQEVESVVLTIPYFSKKTGTAADGTTGVYQLDSIYGSKQGKLKLSIYESGKYIRENDPLTNENQIYYSDQDADFDMAKKSLLNTDAAVSQNSEFFFSNAEYDDSTTDKEGVVTTKKTAPEMRINLDKAFFKDKFFSAAANGQLLSNKIFVNYFRGLYFKVENSGSNETNQMLMNFKQGKITIKYKEDLSSTDQTAENRVEKSIVLNLSGSTVNLLNNTNPATFDSNNLYLKGGQGDMVIVNLFNPLDANGNGVSDELDELRKGNILVNDATLTFYLNKDAMANATIPNRVYLYDLDNNRYLLDYSADDSKNDASKKDDKKVFGGIYNAKDNSYKIKLTYHLRNLVRDQKLSNVRLGLVITENINDITNKTLLTVLLKLVLNQ